MTVVKSIPEGVQAVFPMLVCQSPEAEMNFCAAAFGAVEQVRRPPLSVPLPSVQGSSCLRKISFGATEPPEFSIHPVTCGLWRRGLRRPRRGSGLSVGQRSGKGGR